MWIIFKTHLYDIEGFTANMETEIHQMIMSSHDVVELLRTLSSKIETMLV
jgi:hypothetical protein